MPRRAAPLRLGLHLPLPQWLRNRFAAAARSRSQPWLRSRFLCLCLRAPAPSLRPRLTEAGVVLRPFEPRGQPSPKVSGLGHRLRPGLSQNALELKPSQVCKHLSFAARCGQHRGREWSTCGWLRGGYFNAESEGLHWECSSWGKGIAELSLGKAAYSEF